MVDRIKVTVAYLGAPFDGWQRQPGRRTVQGELERALEVMTGGIVCPFVGAGRTDAGVHAAAQVAHLDMPVVIPPDALVRGLNQHLPREIRVVDARRVETTFHARKSALAKHYIYRVRWRQPRLPWLGLREAVVQPISDGPAVAAALRLLEGRRDMASFTVPDAANGSTERTLHRVGLEHRQWGVDFHFLGDGFLRYQVRRMVGAVLEVGRRRSTLERFRQLLSSPEPGTSIRTAPAHGLTLERVLYRRCPTLSSDTTGPAGWPPAVW